MAAKLTHFAHPRGWEKGEDMTEVVRTDKSKHCIKPVAERVGGVRFLCFNSVEHRDQWLKWWRKP